MWNVFFGDLKYAEMTVHLLAIIPSIQTTLKYQGITNVSVIHTPNRVCMEMFTVYLLQNIIKLSELSEKNILQWL